MRIDPRIEEIIARVKLGRREPTLILLVVATDAEIEESRRALVDILRAAPMDVVDMDSATHETGPAQWVKSMRAHPGDCHTFAAVLPGPFSQNAFANLVNAEREHLRQLTEPMLVFISRETEARLVDRAPDFITWAAATYELPLASELMMIARKMGPAPTSSKRLEQTEIPLRFLHLSDFHLRPKLIRRFDQDRVLNGLVEFLARDRARFPLDAIFITGDLGFSGKQDEYALVVEFLQHLLAVTEVSPGRTFVVPGNHDVDRDIGRWLMRTLPDKAMSDAFFLEDGARDAHTRKFNAYAEALGSILGKSRALGLGVGERAIETIDWHGTRIAIGSFNSAWFAQGDDDKGSLWLGDANVANAADRIAKEEAAFSIALVHHPFEHLNEEDRDAVEYRMERTFDLVMRGHLHNNRARVIRTERGGYVEIAGPAAYQGSQWPNGCFFGEIRPRAGAVRLIPYRYAKGMDPWVLDTTVFPDDADAGHCPTYRVDKKRIMLGAYRKAHEHAAIQAVKDLSTASQQAMAKEFGLMAQSENQLRPQVARKMVQIATLANEDSALWAKPERAKKLDKAIGEAVAEEAFANMTKVPKISRNDPDFLEKALEFIAKTLQSPAPHIVANRSPAEQNVILNASIAAMLNQIVDGPVIHRSRIGTSSKQGDILIGAPQASPDAVLLVKPTQSLASLAPDLNELENCMISSQADHGALILVGNFGPQMPTPRIEHVKTPNGGRDVLLMHLPMPISSQ